MLSHMQAIIIRDQSRQAILSGRTAAMRSVIKMSWYKPGLTHVPLCYRCDPLYRMQCCIRMTEASMQPQISNNDLLAWGSKWVKSMAVCNTCTVPLLMLVDQINNPKNGGPVTKTKKMNYRCPRPLIKNRQWSKNAALSAKSRANDLACCARSRLLRRSWRPLLTDCNNIMASNRKQTSLLRFGFQDAVNPNLMPVLCPTDCVYVWSL